MADYYPLLARALANVSSATPETRKAVYDRAKAALLGQLQRADPPLAEETINAELESLNQATARLELEYAAAPPSGTESVPAAAEPVATPAPPPPPATMRPEIPIIKPPPPRITPPPPAPIAPQAAPPAPSPLPPQAPVIPSPAARTQDERVVANPAKPDNSAPAQLEPSQTIGSGESAPPAGNANAEHHRPAVPEIGVPVTPPVPPVPPLPPVARAPSAQRPTSVETPPQALLATREMPSPGNRPVAPGAAGPRQKSRGRGLAIASFLGLFVIAAAGLGYVSWKWRLLPAQFSSTTAIKPSNSGKAIERAEAPDTPDNENKIAGRAGGDTPPAEPATPSPGPEGQAAPAEPAAPAAPERAEPTPAPDPAPQAAPPQQAAAPAPAAPASGAQSIPIAQRAALLIQAPTPDNRNAVKTYTGTVVWSADNTSSGPNQPPAFRISAQVTLPEAKMRVTMTIEKNTVATLPASHTFTWRFERDEGSTFPVISEVGMVLMRDEGAAEGDPLAGVPAKITPNDYLMALAAPEALLKANLGALTRRGWYDLPMKMTGDLQAKLTLEKGNPGQRLLAEALEKWDQKAP